MSCRALVVLLFLSLAMPLAVASAQDSAPIDLSGPGRAQICRADNSNIPGCIKAPHPTYDPYPDPNKVRKARHGGVVWVSLVVGADGLPNDVKVAQGASPELEEAAVDSVKKWKFAPATRDGKPVPVRIKVEVSIRIN